MRRRLAIFSVIGATMAALAALEELGHLPAEEADVLEASYRFCEGARNRTYLVVGSGDAVAVVGDNRKVDLS